MFIDTVHDIGDVVKFKNFSGEFIIDEIEEIVVSDKKLIRFKTKCGFETYVDEIICKYIKLPDDGELEELLGRC